MLDPQKLMQSIIDGKTLSEDSAQKAAAPFIAQMSGAAVEGGSNASNVISNMSTALKSMGESLDQTAQSAQSQVEQHQEQQRSEVPSDFDVGIDDLRPTESAGFPMEDPNWFFEKLQEKSRKTTDQL